MEVTEFASLDLSDDGSQPPDACCANHSYAACSHGISISLCYLPDINLEPVLLTSSFLPCAAMAIQEFRGQLGGRSKQLLPHEQQQTLLAAATPNGVLLWTVEQLYAAAADKHPSPPPLRLIDSEQQGASEAMVITTGHKGSDLMLAVGCGSTVFVWGLQQLDVLYRLEGHQGNITALAFTPQSQHQLVSAAEDRTFKVWDLNQGQLLYQSSILGAALPTSIALNASTTRLAMGCSDGSLRLFDLSQLTACRELQVLDISKSVQQVAGAAIAAATAAAEFTQASGPKTITAASAAATASVQVLRQQVQDLVSLSTAQPSSIYSPASIAAASTYPELLHLQSEGAGCVLSMQFVQLKGINLQDGSSSAGGGCHSQQLLQELLQPPPQLVVCTRRALLLIDTGRCEVEQCYVFGLEAGRVLDILVESGGRQAPVCSQPRVGVSQLQQPSAQLQQQKARALSSFRAMSCTEQPAASCCFVPAATLQYDDPLRVLCCIASHSSHSLALVELGSECQQSRAGGCTASGDMVDEHWLDCRQQQQVLSVFQTGPLPANSLLAIGDTTKRCSTADSSSSSKSSSSSITAADVPGTEQNSSGLPTSNSGVKQRATWSVNSSGGAAVSGAVGGKLSRATSSPGKTSKAALGAGKAKPKKSLPPDKAVTFHRQIKSSGYGYVQPKIKLGQAKPALVKVGGPGDNSVSKLLAQQLSVQRQYPLDAASPGGWELQPGQYLPGAQAVHNGGILRAEFAGDGSRLLTASTDRTARCLWLPTSKHSGAGTTFVGHSGPVTCVSWSHSGEHLLTASSDRTARLWSCSDASPLITFNTLHQPPGTPGVKPGSLPRCSSSSSSTRVGKLTRSSKGGVAAGNSSPGIRYSTNGSEATASHQQGFLSEVTAARFFHMDQLVLLATGNKLHMYRYKLPDAPLDDDIQRLRASGSFNLAGSYSSSCQAITDVVAANSFLSSLVLLACSNRSIELVDAATLQVAHTIHDAHSRPVQRLVQPAASPFVSHPRGMYELFASAAPDGVVKLWDVRSKACVRNFTGHKHSSGQVPIGVAFSPCMRYLATGSEDKAAYVYDMRTSTMLARLRPSPQSDVVADVAFHPFKLQLVLACMDGRLHWYGDTFQHVQTAHARSGGMVMTDGLQC